MLYIKTDLEMYEAALFWATAADGGEDPIHVAAKKLSPVLLRGQEED